MLTRNGTASGTPTYFRGLGAAALSREPFRPIANARPFGSSTSYPQGYNDPSALKMPLKTNANGAWRVQIVSDLQMQPYVGQQGEMAPQGEFSLSLDASTRQTSSIAFGGEFDLSLGLSQSLQMELPLDILARPSAFDIAQEVWNAAASGYTTAGTLGKELQDARKAAKLAAALSA